MAHCALGEILWLDLKVTPYWGAWQEKSTILIRMQFLNDMIKSRHGFKTAQKLLYGIQGRATKNCNS